MSLRHRGPTRSATWGESFPTGQTQRRNSAFSDSISEARNTIRSSTDDLFFPRVNKIDEDISPNEESHWHSAPLGLALLPAIAGIFFTNGSAVVTDITLLGLAAVFLNWSVRLPWDWYHSARAVRHSDKFHDGLEIQIELELHGTPDDSAGPRQKREDSRISTNATAASRELQIHELAALASCFIFPIIGTWILHSIRSKLSRPSEGLVSNYNLTIFLLAAEIRPFSHLLKMVQARTLYLQRVVASSDNEKEKIDLNKILDISKRLEELEAHVAETAAARLSSSNPQDSNESPSPSSLPSAQDQELIQSLVSQATGDFRKSFQQDIDALNRAVRRYEKRTAVTAYQTESRLNTLETNIRDAIALAVAAQRSNIPPLKRLVTLCLEWIYTIAFLPVQITLSLASLPVRIIKQCLQLFSNIISPASSRPSHKIAKEKLAQTHNSPQISIQPNRKRSKRVSTVQEEE